MRLALTIEYEGTRYHGFQYQVDAPTIQGELERAIEKLTGKPVRVKAQDEPTRACMQRRRWWRSTPIQHILPRPL